MSNHYLTWFRNDWVTDFCSCCSCPMRVNLWSLSALFELHCSLQLYCDTEKPAGREHRKQWWSLFSSNQSSGSGHAVMEDWLWAQEMGPTVMGHLAGVAEFSPVRGQSFTIFFSKWRLFLVKGYRGISMQLCCIISTHKGCAGPKSEMFRHLFRQLIASQTSWFRISKANFQLDTSWQWWSPKIIQALKPQDTNI